jgi:hypothetical protein
MGMTTKRRGDRPIIYGSRLSHDPTCLSRNSRTHGGVHYGRLVRVHPNIRHLNPIGQNVGHDAIRDSLVICR